VKTSSSSTHKREAHVIFNPMFVKALIHFGSLVGKKPIPKTDAEWEAFLVEADNLA